MKDKKEAQGKRRKWTGFRMFTLAFCLLPNGACAPQTNMKFNPDGSLLSITSHEGFLHQADVVATEITGPGGIKIKHLMQKPDGTRVANNLILAAGSAYAVGAQAAVNKAKEITAQTATKTAAQTEQARIAAAAASADAATKTAAQTELLKANPQAVVPAATTLNAP